MPKFENLGQFLKHERLKRNLTQPQFAEYIGISEVHYKYLELNRYGCGVSTLQVISEKLKVSARTLRKLDDATRLQIKERNNNEEHSN